MAVYAMTMDAQPTQGKALLAYLGTLDIRLVHVSDSADQAPCQFSIEEMRDILAQSAAEARTEGGISHADFKREVASWL